jgi:hypothetical protein
MAAIPKPLFRDRNLAIIVGVGLFAAGAFCLHDAWERRGSRTPFLVRAFKGVV